MLTVKQAAERLSISPALIYALCHAGMIAHERYGLGRGTIRISKEALDAYQERSRIEELPSAPMERKHIDSCAPGTASVHSR